MGGSVYHGFILLIVLDCFHVGFLLAVPMRGVRLQSALNV